MEKVVAEKKKVNKQSIRPTTKRNKITTFIAQKQSRQEFVPLVGKLIYRAHVEPLHLKNNACALAHRYLLNEIFSISHLEGTNSFSQAPSRSPFSKYVKTLRCKCGLTRLAKQVIKWFNETKLEGKEFDCHFTGIPGYF